MTTKNCCDLLRRVIPATNYNCVVFNFICKLGTFDNPCMHVFDYMIKLMGPTVKKIDSDNT